MLENISATQLVLWHDLYKVEPWGTEPEEWRWAFLRAQLAMSNGAKNIKVADMAINMKFPVRVQSLYEMWLAAGGDPKELAETQTAETNGQ